MRRRGRQDRARTAAKVGLAEKKRGRHAVPYFFLFFSAEAQRNGRTLVNPARTRPRIFCRMSSISRILKIRPAPKRRPMKARPTKAETVSAPRGIRASMPEASQRRERFEAGPDDGARSGNLEVMAVDARAFGVFSPAVPEGIQEPCLKDHRDGDGRRNAACAPEPHVVPVEGNAEKCPGRTEYRRKQGVPDGEIGPDDDGLCRKGHGAGHQEQEQARREGRRCRVETAPLKKEHHDLVPEHHEKYGKGHDDREVFQGGVEEPVHLRQLIFSGGQAGHVGERRRSHRLAEKADQNEHDPKVVGEGGDAARRKVGPEVFGARIPSKSSWVSRTMRGRETRT